MVTHSSILAWRIPWTEGPGRLQSMGPQRVKQDWATNATSLGSYYCAHQSQWEYPCHFNCSLCLKFNPGARVPAQCLKRHELPTRKVMTNLDSTSKSRDITLPTKVRLVKAGFSSGHVWMWELDCEESWALKNWCFWTVVLEKTLESPLDCEEIQPVHPKGYQSWVFIGRTDVEAETPILWPPDAKSWLIGKDSDAGRDWGQEEKGKTKDEMVGWHHQLHGHEFE